MRGNDKKGWYEDHCKTPVELLFTLLSNITHDHSLQHAYLHPKYSQFYLHTGEHYHVGRYILHVRLFRV